eukprot:TRINITY_DN1662_c1_g1_i1.p1 TRINITY_DN1662_c1_g1~~TRINITY_DN1662_c1_g1_i1.p1  ORF type:complete len:1209 (+),score=391.96 TRINITY_DN1662_c1_g1_i1:57-3683(+)
MWGFVDAAKKAASEAASAAAGAANAASDAARGALHDLQAGGAEHSEPPPSTPESRRQELALRLKHWKAKFTEEHGRAPKNGDLEKDEEIREVYREYKELGADRVDVSPGGGDSPAAGRTVSGTFAVGAQVILTGASPVRATVAEARAGDRYLITKAGGGQMEVGARDIRLVHAFDDLAEEGDDVDLAADAAAAARTLGGWFQTGLATAGKTMSSALDRGLREFEGFVADEKGLERRRIRITKSADHKVGLAFKNLIVTSVTAGGAAATAGVSPGMRIVAVDGVRVHDHDSCLAAFSQAGAEFELTVETDKPGDDPMTALVRAKDETEASQRWLETTAERLRAVQQSGDPALATEFKRETRVQWSEAEQKLHRQLSKLQSVRQGAQSDESTAATTDFAALADEQLKRVSEVMKEGDALLHQVLQLQVQPQSPVGEDAAAVGSPRQAVRRLRMEQGLSAFPQPQSGPVAEEEQPQGQLPPQPQAVAVALATAGRCDTDAYDECVVLEGETPTGTPTDLALALGPSAFDDLSAGGLRLEAAARPPHVTEVSSPATAEEVLVAETPAPAPAAEAAAAEAPAAADGLTKKGKKVVSGGFNADGVAEAVAGMVARHGGVIEAGLLMHAYPGLRQRLAGRKLMQVLTRYPEKFEITEIRCDAWQIRLLGEVDPATAADMEAAQEGKASHTRQALEDALLRGAEYYTMRHEGGEVPLKWLFAHRRVGQTLRAYALACPQVKYAYHMDPEKHGFPTQRAALGAGLCAYLREFVEERSALFGLRTDEQEGGRIYVSLREGVKAPEKVVKAKRPARPKAPTEDEMAAVAGADARRLLSIPEPWVVVCRAASRVRSLHTLELQLRARVASLAESSLWELRSGLWALSGAGGAERAFLSEASRSACVRRSGRLLAATPARDTADFVKAVGEAAGRLRQGEEGGRLGKWRLAYDKNFPCADADCALPFVDMSSQAALAARVVGAVGADTLDDGARRCLAVIHARDMLLLLDCGECNADDDVGGWRTWRAHWDKRPFSFSASLDSGVAAAAVSAASAAHSVQLGQRESSDWLILDGCCGSGTLAAAAAQYGFKRVVGCEIRRDFSERCRRNMALCGVEGVTVLHQDVTEPLPEEAVGADIVLCNPPWGRRFGTEKDCLRVVQAVIRFAKPEATICLVAPKRAVDLAVGVGADADADTGCLRKLHRVPLGAVEVLIAVAQSRRD